MPKHNHKMSTRPSKIDPQSLNNFCQKYHITPEYKPTPPLPNQLITDCPNGYIALYTKHLEFSNLRIPFSNFFLEFLKQYKLNICQLSPLAVIKVTHFEIACRALGGEPTFPLFRQFYALNRHDDWYGVEDRRNNSPALGTVTWVSSCSTWRDYFFWVSAEVVPFKMQWRDAGAPMNVVRPKAEKYDEEMYRKLVFHPMDMRTFPEHVLVLTGLSRNWPHADMEPLLKEGDDEIELVNYLKKKSDDDVKCTRRLLAEKETNVLDRTRGICYEAKGLARVQTEALASSSKRKRLEKSETPKRRGKKVVLSELDESSHEKTMDAPKSDKAPEKDDAGEPSDKDTPKSDDLDSLECIKQVARQDRKGKKDGRLHGQISKYRMRMRVQQARNAKLEKKVKRLAREKGREATVEHAKVVGALRKELEDARAQGEGDKEMVEKLEAERRDKVWLEKSLERERGDKVSLEKSLERERGEKLSLEKSLERERRDKVSLEKSLERERRDRVSLEKSLERVSSERRWLIEEGFEYVIDRLHKSDEYLKPIGVMLSKLWSSGAHAGVVDGYKHCRAGVALKDAGVYKPEAGEELSQAEYELEHIRFPYVVALSQCANRTLDDLRALEPIGLVKTENEDEVVAGCDHTNS